MTAQPAAGCNREVRIQQLVRRRRGSRSIDEASFEELVQAFCGTRAGRRHERRWARARRD